MHEIINEILFYISQSRGVNSGWYAGIASNPKKRLFEDHNVNEADYGWIYVPCINSEFARAIEAHLIGNLGFDGGPGGGDSQTIYVYAYKKASHTKEN